MDPQDPTDPAPELQEAIAPVVLGPLDLMAQATTAAEIAQIQRQFSEEDCQAAWGQLDPAQKAALLLTRFFQGSVIIHDLDDSIDA